MEDAPCAPAPRMVRLRRAGCCGRCSSLSMAAVSVYSRELGWRGSYLGLSALLSWRVALVYGEAWLYARVRPVDAVRASRGRSLPLGSLISSTPGEWLAVARWISLLLARVAVLPYGLGQLLFFLRNGLRAEEQRLGLALVLALSLLAPLVRWLTLTLGVPGVLSFLVSRQGVAAPVGAAVGAGASGVAAGAGVGAAAGVGSVVAFQPLLGPYLSWLWGVYCCLTAVRVLPALWWLLLPGRRDRGRSWSRIRRLGWRVARVISVRLPLGEDLWSPLRVWLPLVLRLELAVLAHRLRQGYGQVRAEGGSRGEGLGSGCAG